MRRTYGAGYPRTLGALLARPGRDPAAAAVTDAAGTLSRHSFHERVLRAAAGLHAAGAGVRVALWLPNSAGYLAAIFAYARLGGHAIHVNNVSVPRQSSTFSAA